MLLPFTINPEPEPASGDPPSDIPPPPTRRTDEPYLLSLMESARPPASAETDALRAVLEAAPVALVALTRHGVITVWNPAAQNLFGWTSEEVLGATAPAEILELVLRRARRRAPAPRERLALPQGRPPRRRPSLPGSPPHRGRRGLWRGRLLLPLTRLWGARQGETAPTCALLQGACKRLAWGALPSWLSYGNLVRKSVSLTAFVPSSNPPRGGHGWAVAT